MRQTSVMNTSHSTNHAQKKTRMRLAMEEGFTSDTDSQMPTPVSAPTVVVMRKATNRMR